MTAGGSSSSALSHGLRIAVGYVKRSLSHIKTETAAAISFDRSFKTEKTLFRLNSIEALDSWIVGSDADMGGLSEAYWGLTPQNTALFWGTLSTELPPKAEFNRSGYAGIRSKEAPLTLFHRPKIDTSMFRYLAVRARGDGNQWFVNLRTDSIYASYVWQHRLFFQRPGEWETVMIPFRDFILTSHGFVQPNQMGINREGIKTLGFSILRQPGDFSMEIDWIKAMNTPYTLGDFDIVPKKMQQKLHSRDKIYNVAASSPSADTTPLSDKLGAPDTTTNSIVAGNQLATEPDQSEAAGRSTDSNSYKMPEQQDQPAVDVSSGKIDNTSLPIK
ncbi:hypothetical protein BASA61_000591 [Batrachochytrium salamandrivorans]|nr:hypothetical protein BASA62_002389 [Batrachochytrium salamandrivorans]KAH6602965.1 hypothetical protein BASA61_000591 [Batrachochytrium salamandrivorans]KAH9276076.1 hypothetical protein BASA83_001349 [Batrachochytrium salamandrivorans]